MAHIAKAFPVTHAANSWVLPRLVTVVLGKVDVVVIALIDDGVLFGNVALRANLFSS